MHINRTYKLTCWAGVVPSTTERPCFKEYPFFMSNNCRSFSVSFFCNIFIIPYKFLCFVVAHNCTHNSAPGTECEWVGGCGCVMKAFSERQAALRQAQRCQRRCSTHFYLLETQWRMWHSHVTGEACSCLVKASLPVCLYFWGYKFASFCLVFCFVFSFVSYQTLKEYKCDIHLQ